MAHTNEVYLKQLFSENYRSKSYKDLSLLEALELERLSYKSRGEEEYVTKILELGWYDSELLPNTIIDLSEQTSVTKMERRVFDIDIDKVRNNVKVNAPYGIYLNFVEHLDLDLSGKTGKFENYYFQKPLRNHLEWLESELDTDIIALGTGPKNGQYILKKDFIKK